jgi:hypothetical protein
MKITKTIALAAATMAVAAVPATALASSASDHSQAQKQCRSEQKSMGKATFDKTFGTSSNDKSAFGKCVSHNQKQDSSDESTAQKNAAKTCKAQQNDPKFADSHGGKTFDQFYGTNKNGKNAFGKCVSQTAKAAASKMEAKQVKAEENAAKTCKTQASDPKFAANHGGQTFAQFYGKNKNDKNAFGKCVSQNAKANGSNSGSGGNGSAPGGY